MGKEDDVSSSIQARELNGGAHETRIQRLEDELTDLKVQHAEVSTNLRNLATQVDVSAQRISDKIDLCVKPLTDTLHDHIKEDAVAKGKLDGIAITVAALDAKETDRANRWANWKKGIATVLLGAGAIGAKELVVAIFHALR